MSEQGQTQRRETRWPPALAILSVFALMEVLPERYRLFPLWFPYVAMVGIFVPMAGAALGRAHTTWLRVERASLLVFFALGVAGTVIGESHLIDAMLFHPSIGGIPLLSSSIAIWSLNVIMFSLVYWQIDRGGPGARENNLRIKPDWLFPQAGVPEDVAPGWKPTFVDYLFLGFCTAAAFSPTDALPLTPRAKLLMMLQSTISLVTIIVVAARAINILAGG